MNTKKKKARESKHRNSAGKALKNAVTSDPSVFPVVGIGASAGGLEALEVFFLHLPVECGIAFVVIQHLDPKHKSIMNFLLTKYTKMEIAEISDGMRVEKNRVYLAPPDHNIALIDYSLHFIAPEKIHGANLSIDYFFRSLAEDRGERSIGVILSGTGTDGTLGLRAIKGAGGVVFAQEEAQAKFSGMPKSAIETGLVDFVLPVEEMPAQIIKYTQHPCLDKMKMVKTAMGDFHADLQKILLLIRDKTGHDFSQYKKSTIRRRIERRMALYQIQRIADYGHYLERNQREVESLFKELLINVTGFFRDPDAFAALAEKGIPGLLERKERDAPFRIWVPGCSTGEEAYSLAMLLNEEMGERKMQFSLQVFASDIDAEAIEIGRCAVYPESISADVSKERLDRFFTKDGECFRVRKQLRACVTFALQDIAKDPPFSRLDLISCRNLFIYMDHQLQEKILPIFQYSLIDRGILFLGTSESVGELAGSFLPIDTKWKIYAKKGVSLVVADYPRHPDRPRAVRQGKILSPAGGGFRTLGEKVIARDFAPPSVLVNENLEVLYCYGPVDRYLAISTGEASLNILRIAREGLCHKLGPALTQALKGGIPVVRKNVRIRSNGELRTVDLIVQPVVEPGEPQRLMMIVFMERSESKTPVTKARLRGAKTPGNDEIETLEQELKTTRDDLQNAIEELRTANEEFQTTNEELQSANEELETSREELQSTNEELVTVNSELQHKVDQLTETSNDVNNLLASTEIASIFLDTELRIKRFTPAIVKIFRLLQTDIGRSIRDITSTIASFNIYSAAADVLAALARTKAEVRNEDNRWFSLTIIPYRTMDNVIDGVVITFVDITDFKRVSREQEEAKLLAEGIAETIGDPFVILDKDLNVKSVNTPFYSVFKVKPEETVNRRIYELGNGQWNIPRLQDLLVKIVPGNEKVTDYTVEHVFPGIGRRTMLCNARRISQTQNILLSIADITEQNERAYRLATRVENPGGEG